MFLIFPLPIRGRRRSASVFRGPSEILRSIEMMEWALIGIKGRSMVGLLRKGCQNQEEMYSCIVEEAIDWQDWAWFLFSETCN